MVQRGVPENQTAYFTAGARSPLMKPSCIQLSEDCRRSPWWIKARPHSCTQHLAPQLGQRFSIHEAVSSMTFGSGFHLWYVQRLQNSHGRTPRAALQGSCYRHDESRRFCPAVHCIPPNRNVNSSSKTLAEKSLRLGSLFGGIRVVRTRRWLLQGCISRNLRYSPFVM